MKTLIICISVHHGNTRKIAQVMAEVLDADILGCCCSTRLMDGRQQRVTIVQALVSGSEEDIIILDSSTRTKIGRAQDKMPSCSTYGR